MKHHASARARHPDAPSTLIAQLAHQLRLIDAAEHLIDSSRAKTLPATTDDALRQRAIWDGRENEVWRRKEAIQAAIASLPALTIEDALVQLAIAGPMADLLGNYHVEEKTRDDAGARLEFILGSVRRIVQKTSGAALDPDLEKAYVRDNDDDGASLDELVGMVRPLSDGGAA